MQDFVIFGASGFTGQQVVRYLGMPLLLFEWSLVVSLSFPPSAPPTLTPPSMCIDKQHSQVYHRERIKCEILDSW
jgi:hypothetical protein